MTFQVGDRVRLVSVPEPWSPTWGVVGDETIVQSLVDDCILGSTGWYWDKANIELVDTPHTDADLAMALELAEADENSCEDFNDAYVACDPRNGNPIYTWDWLRQQVIDALRARGEGQR